MKKEKFSITNLVNNDGCFDLQFRKDTRHKRTGSPTYYRWKIQFVITVPKEQVATLKKAIKIIGCGKISLGGPARNASHSDAGGGQARFSVQKIEDIAETIIPFFTKNRLADNKKKDFDLWQKAVEIIYRNKGKHLATWKKNELNSLIEIHKSTLKYKRKPRQAKWMGMAKTLAKTE